MRAKGWVWACALWFGCSDVVGHQSCLDDAGACAVTTQVRTQLSYVPVVVPTVDPSDLTLVTYLSDNCPSPCPTPLVLQHAGPTSAWTFARSSSTGVTIQVLDTNKTIVSAEVLPPASSGELGGAYLATQSDGSGVLHVRWNPLGPMAQGTETYIPLAAQTNTIVPPVLTPFASFTPRLPFPLGAIMPDPSSLLVFAGVVAGGSSVYLLDQQGRHVADQGTYPSFAQSVGTSAMATRSGFAMAAGQIDGADKQWGILTTDARLAFDTFAVRSDAAWRTAWVLPWAGGEFAAVMQSDLIIPTALDGQGEGNIDVVTVTNASDLPAHSAGFRIERSCSYKLTLFGFTSDSNGTLYVTTVTGSSDMVDAAPRGLLCRLQTKPLGPSQSSTPQCFAAPENVLLGPVAANDDGSVFVVTSRYGVVMGDHSTEQIAFARLPQ